MDNEDEIGSGCSELSGFESDTIQQEEMMEILDSRNKSLIENHLWLHEGKLRKWTRERAR